MSVKLGLAQIPRDGLERLRDWIDEGKPLCMDGPIFGVKGEP